MKKKIMKPTQTQVKTKVNVAEKIGVLVMMFASLSLAAGLVVGLIQEPASTPATITPEQGCLEGPCLEPPATLSVREVIKKRRALQEQYKPDEIIVKFKNETKITSDTRAFNSLQVIAAEKVTKGSALEKLSTSLVSADQVKRVISPQHYREDEIADEIGLNQIFTVKFDNADINIKALVVELEKDPDIEYAELSYLYRTKEVPNDPFYHSSNSWGQGYDDLWGIKRINAEQAWDQTKGEGVIVAVIDTGVDYNHEEIAQNIWFNSGEDINDNGIVDEADFNGIDDDGNGYIDDIRGYDLTECYEYNSDWVCIVPKEPDQDAYDEMGHGTHVAGTIAAVGNNNIGVIGVAPEATIMPVAGLNKQGAAFPTELANAVYYAVNAGADILNNSWGGPSSETVKKAFKYAELHGVLSFAAAGNENSDVANSEPANIPSVMAIASMTHEDQKSEFSNYGLIDVIAPGGDSGDFCNTPDGERYFPNILSLRAENTDIYVLPPLPVNCQYPPVAGEMVVGDDGKYYRARGTSMACPHAAGVGALIYSKYPELSPFLLRKVIRESAEDILNVGFDIYSGHGVIDANAALSLAEEMINNPLPELEVLDAEALPRIDNMVEVNTTIINSGLTLAENITYKLYYDDPEDGIWVEFYEGTIDSLDVKETFSLNQRFPIAEYEPSLISIEVDPENLFEEYSEDNNTLTVPLSIGWPQVVGMVTASAVLANLDGEDGLEVIVGSWDNKVYAWHSEGNLVDGWPKEVDDWVISSVAVFDLDGDGSLEVIVGSMEGTLHVWHSDGTPYWSRPTIDWIAASPAVGDLDGDGSPEVVISDLSGHIYAWHFDGTEVENWPQFASSYWLWSGPTLADLDGDGLLEIIAASEDGNVYAWHGDGSPVEGDPDIPDSVWPLHTNGNLTSSPAVADLDNDGNSEIIIGSLDRKIYAWHSNGVPVDGWPPEENCEVEESSPAVADLDNDGTKEVIVGCKDNTNSVFVWHADGSLDADWDWPNTVFGGTHSSPAVADLDGDGNLEIVIGSGCGDVYAWHADGSSVNGWPKGPGACGNPVTASPTIADATGDGRLDIFAGSWYGDVYGYTVPWTSLNPMPWPTYQQNNQHTGFYDNQYAPVECRPGQLIGDANNDNVVTEDDVTKLEQILAQIIPEPDEICCLDINGDGDLTISDVVIMHRIAAGLQESPGSCSSCFGGTAHDQCLEFNYCNEGNFVGDNCSACGCPDGQSCETSENNPNGICISALQITTEPESQIRPAVYGDKIIWADSRNGNYDIYLYDLSIGGEPQQITTNPADQVRPDIYDNIIVWQDNRSGTWNWDIYFYDLSTQEGPQQVTGNDTAAQYDAAIYGDKIVWVDKDGDSYHIYLYDISSGAAPQKVSTTSATKYKPDIYGDKVVWSEEISSDNYDIFLYDISTGGEPQQITFDSTSQTEGSIYENIIVWTDARNGNQNRDIYMYDLSNGSNPVQITTDTADQTRPVIYGDKIVWKDMRNSNSDIYMYDLTTEEEVQITINSDSQQFPVIYDDLIVWEDMRNGNWDIYAGTHDPNKSPVFNPIGNQSVSVGSLLSFQVIADDADGHGLTYVVNGLPSGANFDPDSQIFNWTPNSDQAGTHEVTFMAMDTQGAYDSEVIQINVGILPRPCTPLEIKKGLCPDPSIMPDEEESPILR